MTFLGKNRSKIWSKNDQKWPILSLNSLNFLSRSSENEKMSQNSLPEGADFISLNHLSRPRRVLKKKVFHFLDKKLKIDFSRGRSI